jgi:PIN domain
MLIVLDANAITPDFFLDAPSFQILSVRIAEGEVQVYVPKVAVIETESNYRRRIDERLAAFQQWMGRTTPLGNWSTPDQVTAELSTAAEAYPSLLAKRLDDIGIEVVAIPDVDHEALVRRATTRRRPFDDNGGGYRDNLIWQTVLDLGSRYQDEIVLVSRDKAFQSDTGELHPDLLQEITERDLDGQIELFPTLAELVLHSLVDRQLGEGESLKTYAADLRLSEIPEWIEYHIPDAISEVTIDNQTAGLPPSAENVSINYIEDIEDIEVIVRDAASDGNRLLVEFSLTANAEIEFVVLGYDEEVWGFNIREHVDDWRCRANIYKRVEIEGLIALDSSGPTSIEVTELRALADDPGVWQWEQISDSCIRPRIS